MLFRSVSFVVISLRVRAFVVPPLRARQRRARQRPTQCGCARGKRGAMSAGGNRRRAGELSLLGVGCPSISRASSSRALFAVAGVVFRCKHIMGYVVYFMRQ